ncbi:MAG: hypothetical protein ACFE8J_01220 [Candidatus Heimdallarchaeota archaeon]
MTLDEKMKLKSEVLDEEEILKSLSHKIRRDIISECKIPIFFFAIQFTLTVVAVINYILIWQLKKI